MELRIVAGEYTPYCKQYLTRELSLLKRRGISVSCTEKPPGVFRCRLKGRKARFFSERNICLRWAVARAVALLVADHWERLMHETIRPYGLLLEDWGLERIRHRVGTMPGFTDRLMALVRRRVADFLEESSVLHIQGFVHFRLRDIVAYLTRMAEKTLDALVFEQEQAEYINLLRQVAARKRSQTATVHVVIFGGMGYRLYNEEMKSIGTGRGAAPCGGENNPDEDELVATVINLAPQTIVMHRPQAVPFAARILKEVFGPAFRECRGCRLCKVNSG